MEKQEEEEKEEGNEIKIGEIYLKGAGYTLAQLGDLVIAMLLQPEIKEYLDLVRAKKGGTYVG